MSAEVQFRQGDSALVPPGFLSRWAGENSKQLCWVKADRTRHALGSDVGPEPVVIEMLPQKLQEAFKKISRDGMLYRQDVVLCVADQAWFDARDAMQRRRLDEVDSGDRWASETEAMVDSYRHVNFDPSKSNYPDLKESVTFEVEA